MTEQKFVPDHCPECGEPTAGCSGSELHLTPQGHGVFYHAACWKQYNERLSLIDARLCDGCGQPIPNYGVLVVRTTDLDGHQQHWHFECWKRREDSA